MFDLGESFNEANTICSSQQIQLEQWLNQFNLGSDAATSIEFENEVNPLPPAAATRRVKLR